MPTLSVTLIGLLVAGLVLIASRSALWRTVIGGLVGAWAGFVAGALVGVLVDVVTGNGVYVAIVGHGAALVGAVVGARRADHTEPVS